MRRRQSALVFLDKMTTRGEYLFTEVSPDGGAVGKVGSSDAEEDAGDDDNMNNYNNVNNLDPRRKGMQQEVSSGRSCSIAWPSQKGD